jgi:hypothetical protein
MICSLTPTDGPEKKIQPNTVPVDQMMRNSASSVETSMIELNAINCNKCGTLIKSESRHDFVWCPCKSVAVDGGKDYLRRVGNPEDWEEKSICVPESVGWWCCNENFPDHEFTCPNYKKEESC